MKDVHVVGAVRTPFGGYDGSPAGMRPDDPAAHAGRELRARTVTHQLARIGVGRGRALVLDR